MTMLENELAITVPCPRCNAGIGVVCTGIVFTQYPHNERVARATANSKTKFTLVKGTMSCNTNLISIVRILQKLGWKIKLSALGQLI